MSFSRSLWRAFIWLLTSASCAITGAKAACAAALVASVKRAKSRCAFVGALLGFALVGALLRAAFLLGAGAGLRRGIRPARRLSMAHYFAALRGLRCRAPRTSATCSGL